MCDLPDTPPELYNDPVFLAEAADMASEDVYADDDDDDEDDEEEEDPESVLDSDQEF